MIKWVAAFSIALVLAVPAVAEEMEHHHDHPAPERLGAVNFVTSCNPEGSDTFNRAGALLHSFAYTVSEQAFRDVAAKDPGCAMAHWGMAMTHYHQLWEPPSNEELREGDAQIGLAAESARALSRELQFIDALDQYYRDWDHAPHATRANAYAHAMAGVARAYPERCRSPDLPCAGVDRDRATGRQNACQPETGGRHPRTVVSPPSAAPGPGALPDPCERQLRHGGARSRCRARVLEDRAVGAARAAHALAYLHAARLWDDSIASNIAARAAARAEGDVGEELHAMDYLTYAYLQRGRDADAEQVVAAVQSMKDLPVSDFKVGYAANAILVRFAVERRNWEGAAQLEPLPRSPPQFAAITYWARALGRCSRRVPEFTGRRCRQASSLP